MTTPDLPLAYRRFLETCEPLRADLYRYARYLTRSSWDAEDLAQDAMARAFVTLAQMHGAQPPNLRAWLFRIASNLWIDQLRKRREVPLPQEESWVEPQATREAAGTLLGTLAPRERAAVVLKDVFELSLEEIADALATTPGAVKAALHRGRGKLADETPPAVARAPVPAVLEAFCRAFDAGDLNALTALLLESSSVQVVGATTQYGPEAARKTVLQGMLFGTRVMASDKSPLDPRLTAGVLPELPRVEPRFHRGRWVLLHWYKHSDGDFVRAFTTLQLDENRVAGISNYFYNSELIEELGGELGVPVRTNGHLWWRREVA
jgi:RNA polymerase sigma-70 factor (ECF subfamily)